MGDIPDIRVRLSAEGLSEVISALKQIRGEAQTTAEKSGRSFGGFNNILEKSTGLLEAFGIAVSVGALVEFVKHGAEAASVLTDTAEAVGLTTTQVQALFALAQQSGVGFEKLTSNLDHFQQKLDALQAGDAGAKDLFKRIGLAAGDLKGKDLAQALDIVAAATARFGSSAAKTTFFVEAFGRSGARLIPVLNDLAGDGGLGAVVKAAEESGKALDQNVIAGAARVENQIRTLQQIAGNLATTFASELGPALSVAFGAAGEELVNLQHGIHDTGPGLRALVDLIDLTVLGVIALTDRALDVIRRIVAPIGGLLGVAFATVKDGIDGGLFALRKLNSDLDDDDRKFKDRMEKRRQQQKSAFERLISPDSPSTTATTGSGGGRTLPSAGDGGKAAHDRAALEAALTQNELKRTQLLLKAQEDLEKSRFDTGLANLQDYYSRRRFLIETAAAAEIAALTKRLDAEKQNPDDAQRRLNTANLTAEIDRRKLQLQVDLNASIREEALERDKLAHERIAVEDKVLELQGKRHQKALNDINEEVIAFATVLSKSPGISDDDALKRINQLQQALSATEEFRRQSEALSIKLADLDRARAEIQAQITNATIGEFEGKLRIAALDSDRALDLQRIADLAVAAARDTHDPQNIVQAEAAAQAIRHLGENASESQKLVASFSHDVNGIVNDNLTQALLSAGHGFEEMGAAGVNAFKAIISEVDRLIAKMAATRFLELLAKLAVPKVKGGFAPNPGVPEDTGFAAGGLIDGPGTGTSDSIVARISKGEYIVRAAAVSQPGILALLESINHQVHPIDINSVRMPRVGFADGGLVDGGAGATATLGGRLEVDLGPDLVARYLDSPAGQKKLLHIVSRRPRAFGAALGIRR